ncbi:MAG: stage III sporulation protein AE [Acutalibacteraceae bacterium]|jgi:stage III sporulation protein AE
MIKKIIITSLFFLALCIPVQAEETPASDFYKQQAELSGVDRLEENLPSDTREFLRKNGIKPEENGWAGSLSTKSVFSHIWEFFKAGAKTPLVCGGMILAVILISGALNAVETEISSTTAAYAITVSCAAVITAPLLAIINTSVDAMQATAKFMLTFVPVFAALVAASGQAVTSVSMSSLLLGAAQGLEMVATHFVIPLMCGYLSISIASGVSPMLSRSAIADSIKKISFWVMAFVTTIFVGVLSIQTVVNTSADSLSMRTAKFIIGTTVPVAGTALSEAFTTVTASLGMLKTSVAIYGAVACWVIFLPLIIELLLWRCVLNLTAVAADIFAASKTASLLRNIDTAISVLFGILLLTCAMFTISLTMVVFVGKAQ